VVGEWQLFDFALALHPCHRLDATAAQAFAASLGAALSKVCKLWGHSLRPSLSIGYSLCDRPRQPGEPGALQAAMAACARAMAKGAGTIETDPVRDLLAHRLHRSAGELLNALESRAITAHFQPQICLRTGAITGCEALARWHHPVRGLISPATFLPAIEAAELTTTLALSMLRDSLELLVMLDQRGLHMPTVSINVTEQDLRRVDLPDRIAWELDRHDLAPERLVLEILESVTTESDADLPTKTIARLAELGCRIDLDDYGTGNASIMGIRRFAVDRLKIDRSYVRQLDRDARQRQMVSAILSMARALDLDTLAEGVETQAEMEMLMALGCGHAQGFGIARPMPADGLTDWLRKRAMAPTTPWAGTLSSAADARP
jgi:diguanylate cyclase